MTVLESSGKTGGKLDFSALERARRISVAPMMDWQISDLCSRQNDRSLYVASLSISDNAEPRWALFSPMGIV